MSNQTLQLQQRLQLELSAREVKGERRQLPSLQDSARIHANFASNDYLGLGQKTCNGLAHIEQQQLGATGSRLLTGHNSEVENFEVALAADLQADSALLFTSGYCANVGLMSTIARAEDVILYDEYLHASLREGIRLSKATALPFRHNDLAHLFKRLEARPISLSMVFVVIESLYSMDGDLAPLNALCDLCDQFGATLVVDEAHATGVYGPSGEGLVVAEGLSERVPIRIHTFGKAIGHTGACVAGPLVLKEYLMNFCAHFIYTTALSPLSCFILKHQFTLSKAAHEERLQLRNQVRLFHRHFRESELQDFYEVRPADFSPIIPLYFQNSWMEQKKIALENKKDLLKQLSLFLKKRGVLALPIMSPTVPRGKERLRLSFQASSDETRLVDLINGLKQFAIEFQNCEMG